MISYKFYRLKPILYTENLKIMYYAFAQSYFLYAILAWGEIFKTHLKPLETVQKSILKTIFNKPRCFPSEDLFAVARVCSIRILFVKTLLLYTFKHKLIPEVLHSTRASASHKIKVPKMFTSLGQRQGAFLGPNIFNTLPTALKLINDYTLFKKKLCLWLHAISYDQFNQIF